MLRANSEIAVATSAVREATNRDLFIARAAEEAKVHIEMLSGIEEARLIALAVTIRYKQSRRQRALVIDIGGGSVEITCGGEKPQLAKSFKVGVIRLTERFVTTDPLSERDERRLVKYVQGEIGAHVKAVVQAGYDRAIGTSGTILSLGTMAAHEMLGEAPELEEFRIGAVLLAGLDPVVHRGSAVAVRDPPARQVVGGQLDLHPVAGDDADEVLAHLSGRVRQHDVVVVELDLELSVGQGLGDRALATARLRRPLASGVHLPRQQAVARLRRVFGAQRERGASDRADGGAV